MLLLSEIKKTITSISFVILIVLMVIMSATQGILRFSESDKLERPSPVYNYGMYAQGKEIPDLIMPAALNSLYEEFLSNNYTAYPIGFYKNVKLSDEKQQQMSAILSELTGLNPSALTGCVATEISISPHENITYEQFKKCMQNADNLIGGGSDYSDAYLKSRFGAVPITYEEAAKQYQLTESVDKYTGGYARLFSDYMPVCCLGIIPVLLAVVMCLKDKQAKMSPLIYSRKISSCKLIFARYAAIIISIMIPVIILAYISNISVWRWYSGMSLDYLAPLKYSLGWTMPTVMMATAVGMVLTELTRTPIAIIIQGIWWFIDMNISVKSIYGGYSLFALSPRHNSIKYTDILVNNFNALVANRILFTSLSLILVIITVIIYELKRRGVLGGKNKIVLANYRNRQSKSAA